LQARAFYAHMLATNFLPDTINIQNI